MKVMDNQICSYLRANGVTTAAEIATALRVSQPTISRALSSLGGQRIIRIGRARSTRYALRAQLPGNEYSVYLFDKWGKASHLGLLYRLTRGEWLFYQDSPWESLRGNEFRDGLYPGLPWFLQDMRPRGFLGRCFARSHAQVLQAPQNPSGWSEIQVLDSLLRFGQDMPGALVIGQDMLNRVNDSVNARHGVLDESEIPIQYLRFAEQSLAGDWPGSSAAGEQPKFTTTIHRANGEIRHVLVKFSGDIALPEAQRWSDLLHAENRANRVLSAHGLPCAQSRIVYSGGRTFLESERFDRCGISGRCAVVSLEALDAAYTGVNHLPWNRAAGILRDERWINTEDAERLSLFWWFGVLIGNNDMHYGNISLFLDPAPPLRLAPLYDMVPMRYRPGLEGTLPRSTLNFIHPPPEDKKSWSEAAVLAQRFWELLAEDSDISPDCREIASRNRDAISTMR